MLGASRPFVCQQPHDVDLEADDGALVLAVQAGDVAAYAELFRRHHAAVKRVCARRLGELEADEVAQAAFVRAFERIHQCQGDRRFGGWVQVIARRLCLDLIRARTRTVPDDDPLRDHRVALNVVIDLDAGTVTEEAQVRRERTERVQEALALLPDRQREVVMARHFEGRRPPEIAASLGLSVGAVDSLLLRARRRLALNCEHVLADGPAAPSLTSTGAGMAPSVLPGHAHGLPDAVANLAHQVVAVLPAIHDEAAAPLRRLAAAVAAAAAPMLLAAPPPADPAPPTPAVVAPAAAPPAAAGAVPAGAPAGEPAPHAAAPGSRAAPAATAPLLPAAATGSGGAAVIVADAAAAVVSSAAAAGTPTSHHPQQGPHHQPVHHGHHGHHGPPSTPAGGVPGVAAAGSTVVVTPPVSVSVSVSVSASVSSPVAAPSPSPGGGRDTLPSHVPDVAVSLPVPANAAATGGPAASSPPVLPAAAVAAEPGRWRSPQG